MVAVAGSGPAGLMAAWVVAEAGHPVTLYEKRPAAGRKLLIAGSSGLNVTYDAPLPELLAAYRAPDTRMAEMVAAFRPREWLAFIETLGVKTFRGTSRRWFVGGLKAPPLLQRWLEALEARGVQFAYQKECVGFSSGGVLRFADGTEARHDAAALCLGGGSWEKTPVRWPEMFRENGVAFNEFCPANIGWRVSWPEKFLAEAEGKPLKNVVLTSSRGKRAGDLVVTAYGIEGTPVYFVGERGVVHLDLKPDLTDGQVLERLQAPKENLSPMRRVAKSLRLCEASRALLYHMAACADLDSTARAVKKFPLELLGTQPLEEAISSAGGVDWSELDEHLMLKSFPGIFVAGEMIDWDAPTGGFLIQGCVAQGRAAGEGILKYLAARC